MASSRVKRAVKSSTTYYKAKRAKRKTLTPQQKWDKSHSRYKAYKSARVDIRRAESLGFSLYGKIHRWRGKKGGFIGSGQQRRRPKGGPHGGEWY